MKESTSTSKLETLDELDNSNLECVIEPKKKKRKHIEEDGGGLISNSKKESDFSDDLQLFINKIQSKSAKNSKSQENERNRERYERITQIQNEMMMDENH